MWFAFKLVSLNHWEQFPDTLSQLIRVVICFQISIFEPLGTIQGEPFETVVWLWFAFKLVSLNHWEQFNNSVVPHDEVVICFQISIFEPLGTIRRICSRRTPPLWFAFKLVSLNHWEQFSDTVGSPKSCCDLLSN